MGRKKNVCESSTQGGTIRASLALGYHPGTLSACKTGSPPTEVGPSVHGVARQWRQKPRGSSPRERWVFQAELRARFLGIRINSRIRYNSTMNETSQEARQYPSLRQRVAFLFIYGVGLYVVAAVAAGSWQPTGGGQWVWWISAIALYLFNTLSAPFFVRPRDALANAVGSALMLFTLDLTSVQALGPELETFRNFRYTYSAVEPVVRGDEIGRAHV